MSPLTPWTQPAALPPGAPEEAPPKRKKSWWEQGVERMGEEGWTWPWEAAHWERPGATAAKWGLGVGGAAAGAVAGMAAPGLMFGLGSKVPWLGGLAKAGLGLAGHPFLTGLGGAGAGYLAAEAMTPPGAGRPAAPTAPVEPPGPPTAPAAGPAVGETRVNYGPTGIPILETWDGTSWVGPEREAVTGAAAQPEVVEIEGQRFWWDPTGGMYGTGGWSIIPAGAAPGPTPEQQEIQTTEQRRQRQHQIEMLELQYELEQQTMGTQAGYGREQQAAAAAQQMAQMYAADPYKYWAQMGQGTPGAVARLTGGQVAPGQQFQGAPLSIPSAQWWQNLLPSEQQQIAGGLNWMGVDPQDWYSMYQRMIPGLGARQMEPTWAR